MSRHCGPAVVNSSGESASIRSIGSSVATDNNLWLLAEGMARDEFGMFLVGPTQVIHLIWRLIRAKQPPHQPGEHTFPNQ